MGNDGTSRRETAMSSAAIKKAKWRQWVKAHEAELMAIGIPREVWADEKTWGRFLEHGRHPPIEHAREVRFRLEDLPPGAQLRFFRFL